MEAERDNGAPDGAPSREQAGRRIPALRSWNQMAGTGSTCIIQPVRRHAIAICNISASDRALPTPGRGVGPARDARMRPRSGRIEDLGRGTHVREHTRRTTRGARKADGPSVKDEAKAERAALLGSDDRIQVHFDGVGILRLGEAETTRETADVGVDGETRLAERDAPHDVRGLAPDTRQRDEVVHRGRNDTSMTFDQRLGHSDQALRLRTEEPRRADHLFDALGVRTRQRERVGVLREQRRGDFVHAHVRRLRREDRRSEKLKRVLVPKGTQLDGRTGICRGETRDDDADTPFERSRRCGGPGRGHGARHRSHDATPGYSAPVAPDADAAIQVDVESTIAPAVRVGIAALLEAALEVDGYESFSDRARLLLDDEESDGTRLILLAHAATHESSVEPHEVELAGVSLLDRAGEEWDLESAVLPRLRRAPVFDALVRAAVAEVSAQGGGRVASWHRGADDGGPRAMEHAGLRAERVLLQLRSPLPVDGGPDAGPPVDVRSFRPGRDEQAWLDVNRRAFAGHPEQGRWTLKDLEAREREPWFDPGGFLIHEVDGRIAAFCWTKVHREPCVGEIYVIGVDPDFQGRGLGRALTLAGLKHLAARGVPAAMLYVEATNAPALVMYRSLGFTEDHREVLYRGDVPGQVETPTARPIP